MRKRRKLSTKSTKPFCMRAKPKKDTSYQLLKHTTQHTTTQRKAQHNTKHNTHTQQCTPSPHLLQPRREVLAGPAVEGEDRRLHISLARADGHVGKLLKLHHTQQKRKRNRRKEKKSRNKKKKQKKKAKSKSKNKGLFVCCVG